MIEYEAAKRYCEHRIAARSGIPYIHHIDEGLQVLQSINATEEAKRAFCLHLLFQKDSDLQSHKDEVSKFDPYVIMLAMEYRSVANECLSTRDIRTSDDIRLSPLDEVNQMLIADKVQNYKDFLIHHQSTHPRADALTQYFTLWLMALGVSEARYNILSAGLGGRN